MSASQSRVGIERKILTSILWVGIFPMALALIVGYIAARTGQNESIQQTLLTNVKRTTDGLQLATSTRLNTIAALAQAPDIIQALTPQNTAQPNQPLASPNHELLRTRLSNHYTQPKSNGVVISLYDAQRNLVVTTNPPESPGTPQLNTDLITGLTQPRFDDFLRSTTGQITALLIAPVLAPDSPKILGYVTLRSAINDLLEFTLGQSESEQNDPSHTDHYQLVQNFGGKAMGVIELESITGPGYLKPAFGEIEDPTLQTLLDGTRNAGSQHISDYQVGDLELDVHLAFYRIENTGFPGEFYLVAYRFAPAIFQDINPLAGLAVTVCIIVIAFLCLKAYRDVHNNIVRPVSLLNEGAQIIRQGDFDLKLKIDTGDEIEELASSFNKMALALKRNIRQLGESEEKYRTLVTSMRDGILQINSKGMITFLNPAGIEILGFPNLDEALKTNLNDMFVEDVNIHTLSAASDIAQDVSRSRIWMKRWDDRTICVELLSSPIHDDSGGLLGTEGIIRDVTENVHIEEQARERSERISTINQLANVINSSLEAGLLYESLAAQLKNLLAFDYAAVALISDQVHVFNGRQLWPDNEVHPGYTFTLEPGHSCSEWVEREEKCLLVDDLQHPPSPFAENFPSDVKSCLCIPLYATDRIIGTLNLGHQSTGAFSEHDIEVLEQMAPHLAVAIGNARLLVDLQLSLEEVTRAREKLHEANEELKTLDEMKTNLLSNVSHELRTPLVAVMGYNDMILNGKAGPISNAQQEYLEISLRNIEKLVTLIENLLDFSRLHRGDERAVFDTYDLVDCARMSIQIIQPLADGRHVELELLAPDGPILTEGDKGKIGQVFNNLLSNAVKFNHGTGSVTIELRPADTSVEVIVTDTGIGIPSEALEKIFTRFYQFDSSSTRKYGGTGIGLSIAQDIVRLHGSSITVTSEVGEGSVFRFRLNLPTHRNVVTDDAHLPTPEETHLLVELVSSDNALSVQVRNLLVADGMDMIHASSSDNAIALAQRHSPDCLLVDLGSNGDGRATLDDLLANPTASQLPFIILTNEDETYEQYRKLVAARVKRSFRKSSLLGGIHHALSRSVERGEAVGDRVLCIDDDPEILAFMSRCLHDGGFETNTCESGEQALRQLAEGNYGLVLLDIAMPGMDGWETCKRIREIDALAGIKIYLVTAKPIDHGKLLLNNCTADGFLLKPFRAEDLVQLAQGLEIGTGTT